MLSTSLGVGLHMLLEIEVRICLVPCCLTSPADSFFFFYVGLVYLTRPPKIMLNSTIALPQGWGWGFDPNSPADS